MFEGMNQHANSMEACLLGEGVDVDSAEMKKKMYDVGAARRKR